MSEKAKEELKLQKERRVAHFQKSLTEFAELEVINLNKKGTQWQFYKILSNAFLK